MIVAGTGHRPPRLGLGYDEDSRRILREFCVRILDELRPEGVISGGAQGFDTGLAEAALQLRIDLCVAVPFDGQQDRWPADARVRYDDMCARAARVVVVSPGGYSAKKFIIRDHWMADNADAVVGLYDGIDKGGTAETFSYAASIGRPSVNYWPEWQRCSFQRR